MIMNTTRVAVVGSGIPGAVCASTLTRSGVSVTLFKSARVPSGRMSQRRETYFICEIDLNLVPELSVKLNDIPVRPCFALMIAFSEPQSSIPFKGFSIRSSEVLSWAHCESSKPGRSTSREGPFPAASVAREEKCLWDKNKRLAIRGDFCVSPNVEGAIASRIAAASKLTEILSCL